MTVEENSLDTTSRLQLTQRNGDGREAKTIPRSKIVDERLIAKVKALREESKTQDEIAVELGVVQSTVSAICGGAALAAVCRLMPLPSLTIETGRGVEVRTKPAL